MATPVEVPKLGNTVEECLVSRWVKRKGDAVSAGDVVAEIETDKATFEVTAPVSGTVIETYFEEGALVPVFTKLFVIGEPGESVEPGPSGAGPRPAQPREAAPETSTGGKTAGATFTAPEILTGGKTAGATTLAATTSASFSPRARRFAEEHRFYPPTVSGSGPGGRVLEEDLRELYYSPRTRAVAPVSPPARTDTGKNARATIREKIARRMRESLASTAQYTLNASADAGGLLALRARIKASCDVPDINLNDLVTFCAIRALLEMPALNAEFIDGKIHSHSEVHIGFACDTPRGLLVPVVRNAHQLSIGDLASAMKALTAQAVQGGISPDYLSGATFTVSNLGGLGIESFTPLLNPPQVAVLGVGAIQVKPVRRHGTVEFMDAIGLSLTCDHQVIDGAPGARFLQIVKEKIENVERLCTI
jgi:pyruvate dehydrogenase E2 component (dihydrolipoamide acetyltransferase)